MKIKTITKIISLLFVSLIITACGQRDLPTDVSLADGGFFYRNSVLGFSLILPKTFEHYQTQRVSSDTYTDLEIFIPTSDARFGKQVSGYAKSLTIRVFDEEAWKAINKKEDSVYKFLGDKKNKIFTALFWKQIPSDWNDKWSEEIKNTVINSFEIE
jgi:hypothetical protein